MFSVQHMSLLALAGTLAVAGVGVLSFILLVVLRVQRRGAARSWSTPGAIALCLMPLAAGIGCAGLILRQVLGGLALTGAGGVAAVAAGSVETLVPLLVGLVAALLLAGSAFLMTAAGSSRSTAPDANVLSGWVLLAVSLVLLLLTSGLVALYLATLARLNGPSPDLPTLPTRLSVLLAGAFGLVLVTFVAAIASAFMAPRGPSGGGMMVASLGALALCGLLSGIGLWATWSQWQVLDRTAMSGLRDGELPEPPPEPMLEEPAATPMPPPPPPPQNDRPDPVAPRSKPRASTPRSVEDPKGRIYRVGGAIKEPTKLKNVSPVYPELAKQARIKGVVILEATIGPRGDVTSVTILRGVHPLLDEAAVDAVKQWVYSPTLLNGVPVPLIMTVTVNFKLQ